MQLVDEQASQRCEHPRERTITYSTNQHSGCGAPQDREITHCYECSKNISVIDRNQ